MFPSRHISRHTSTGDAGTGTQAVSSLDADCTEHCCHLYFIGARSQLIPLLVVNDCKFGITGSVKKDVICRMDYKKGTFLYSAISSPQDRSKRFTLHFPDRPVHSDTISASLGSIQPYATINARRLLVHTYPPLSIASYSFIQLSELERCRVKKTCPKFLTPQHRIRTQVLVVESPMLYL